MLHGNSQQTFNTYTHTYTHTQGSYPLPSHCKRIYDPNVGRVYLAGLCTSHLSDYYYAPCSSILSYKYDSKHFPKRNSFNRYNISQQLLPPASIIKANELEHIYNSDTLETVVDRSRIVVVSFNTIVEDRWEGNESLCPKGMNQYPCKTGIARIISDQLIRKFVQRIHGAEKGAEGVLGAVQSIFRSAS